MIQEAIIEYTKGMEDELKALEDERKSILVQYQNDERLKEKAFLKRMFITISGKKKEKSSIKRSSN